MQRINSACAIALIALSACTMHGHRTEDGTINLGPNALGDDRISHRTYAGYAEYAQATGELKNLEADGLSKTQQICWANALLDNLPKNLADRLNAYARNETSLMESEYAALTNELEPFLKNQTVAASTMEDFKAKCLG